MYSRCLVLLSVVLGFAASLFAAEPHAEDLSVLPPQAEHSSLRGFLQRECLRMLQERRENYEQVQTPEDVHRWQAERREFFLKQLGEFPERTPLNAKTVGTLEGDGYRIEKVIYESRPKHRVTANLYLPTSPPPYPAVIIPCGHSFNGKAAEGYQRVSILMARNGIAALCYDPIGQGERYQTFDADGQPLHAHYEANPGSLRRLEPIPGRPNFNPVEEHTLVGIGSILVGRNTASYRVYDGMRSIDYLLSRPDIDRTRIGCTGNSGGGTLTAYLMALDERIACAAPACYLTTFERLLPAGGPQDAEQNIFGQIAYGLDQGDYVLMRAPRPTLLLAGTRDATFDIRGTWDIFREGKRFYARLDHPERLDMVEADAPHGFTVQLRIGAVRWMRRWLLEQDDAVSEPDFPVWSDEDLQCTPQGQVMLLPNERSVFDLNRAEESRLAKQRAALWKNMPRERVLDRVRQTVGVRPLDQLPALDSSRQVGTIERDGYRIAKMLLASDGGLPLPALAFTPNTPVVDAYMYLHGEGKHVDAGVDGPMERLVRQGHLVLAVDLQGIGETAGDEPAGAGRRHWSRALFGADGESFWLAYLQGQSLVGLRTEDVLAAGRFLSTYGASDDRLQNIHVVGIGTAGLPALHAAALEPELFKSLTLRRTLRSWADVVHAPLGHAHLTETVHGALRYYDLPDLVQLIGTGRVTIDEPVVPK